MALPAAQAVIQSADAAEVEKAFSNLISNLRVGRWLGAGNRYAANVINQLKTDLTSGSVDDSDLGQYLAASVPLHCADGWAYLGRALDCHFRGDSDGARHLGYYAELRAALAFLAAQGYWCPKQPARRLRRRAENREDSAGPSANLGRRLGDPRGDVVRAGLLGEAAERCNPRNARGRWKVIEGMGRRLHWICRHRPPRKRPMVATVGSGSQTAWARPGSPK